MRNPDFEKWAKEYGATFLVKLTDKQHKVAVAALVRLLEEAFYAGRAKE